MLNLRRLQLLALLHELGTMSAVADTVRMTRPAVSQQLGRLEEEVGSTLLFRDGRNVRLTPAGVRLAEHAAGMLEAEAEARAEMTAIRAGFSGSLTIAGFGSAVSALVPTVLRHLTARAPHVDVSISEVGADAALRGLSAQEIDIAVIDDVSFPNAPLAAGLQVEPLYDDELFVVLPAAHRLANRDAVALEELADERWVLNEGSTGWHRMTMAALRTSGFEPRLVRGSRGFGSSLALVAHGAGVTLQPTLALTEGDPALAAVPIEPRLVRQVFVAYRRAAREHPLVDIALHSLHAAVAARRAV